MMDPETPPRPLPAWAKLHLWQMQPVRDVLVGLAVVGLFIVAKMTSVVTVPLLLAILLAYLFEPVIVWLMRRLKVSRRQAVSGIIGMSALFIVVPTVVGLSVGIAQLAVFGSQVIDNIRTVQHAQQAGSPDEAQKVFDSWSARNDEAEFGGAWLWAYERLNESGDEPSMASQAIGAGVAWVDENREQVATTLASFGVQTAGRILGWFGAIFGLGFMSFITLFFFFFTATEWVKLKGFGVAMLPHKNRDRIIDLFQKFDRVVSGFVRGRLTIAFLQAIIFSVGYFVVGVPGAFILGPAVAVLSIIPYLSIVGVPISILMLLLAGHAGLRGEWWWVVGAPILIYWIGQALDDYVFTPLIQGKSTNMDIPTIVFASLAGGTLFGFFGLLIGIPVGACVKILAQEVFWPRFKEWAEGRAEDPLPIE